MRTGLIKTCILAVAATATLAIVPARAQDDMGMHRRMEHRMMRHEMHREMRHRMMRHEMRREMHHRMMHRRMMHEGM